MTKTLRILGSLALILGVLATLGGCKRIKQVKQMAESVSALAESGEELSKSVVSGESGDEIDWDSVDFTERDVRRFYEGMRNLAEAYPDMEFEVAMTATMQAMEEGVDLKKAVEKETDMSFDEYNRLSNTFMFVMMQAANLQMAEMAVEAIEAGMIQYEQIDPADLTEEQKAAMEEQKQELAEAKAELESEAYRERSEKVDMVISIRDEMGL